MKILSLNKDPKGSVELLDELDNIRKLLNNCDSVLNDDEEHKLLERRFEIICDYDWKDQVFEENGKVGVKSLFGEVLVPAKFDGIIGLFGYFDNYAKSMPIVLDDKDVLVKRDGTGTVISEKYDEIRSLEFSDLYRFKKDGKVGAITMDGKVIVEECDGIQKDEATPYLLFKKNGKFGLYNWNITTEAIFDDVEFDSDGPVRVVMNGQSGFILENGGFTTDEDEDNLWYNGYEF